MLDQVLEQGIRQPLLVRPLRIAEDAVQGVGVGLLNVAHRALERRPDVAGRCDVAPVAAFRDLEAVLSGNEAYCSSPRLGDASAYSSS